MLKFIKGNLENIHDVQIFPIISLLIFFSFFVGLFIYVFTRKKEEIDKISHIPLENDFHSEKEINF